MTSETGGLQQARQRSIKLVRQVVCDNYQLTGRGGSHNSIWYQNTKMFSLVQWQD